MAVGLCQRAAVGLPVLYLFEIIEGTFGAKGFIIPTEKECGGRVVIDTGDTKSTIPDINAIPM